MEWDYEAGGKLKRKPAGDPNGVPQKRPANRMPPCESCRKIPPGVAAHWSNAVNPTARSRRALAHYRECKAVGWNCDDANDQLVRQHAALIKAVEDMAERAREQVQSSLMVGLATRAGENKRGR